MKLDCIIVHYDNAQKPEVCCNCRCRLCGAEWTAIAPFDADLTRLECYKCGAEDNSAAGAVQSH